MLTVAAGTPSLLVCVTGPGGVTKPERRGKLDCVVSVCFAKLPEINSSLLCWLEVKKSGSAPTVCSVQTGQSFAAICGENLERHKIVTSSDAGGSPASHACPTEKDF